MLNTHSSSHQVFDYMLNHDKMYDMRAIRMVPYNDDDSEPVSILCFQLATSLIMLSTKAGKNYDGLGDA